MRQPSCLASMKKSGIVIPLFKFTQLPESEAVVYLGLRSYFA